MAGMSDGPRVKGKGGDLLSFLTGRQAGNGWTRRGLLMGCGATGLTMALAGCAQHAGAPSDSFSLALVGDIIYLRPALAVLEADSAPLLARLRSADVTFGNFESSAFTLDALRGSRAPSAAGPIVLASPEAVSDVAKMGFDLVSAANNHGYDWREEGAAQTLLTLRRQGLAVAGSGLDLASARSATAVTAGKARVALVAATTSFADDAIARDADRGAGVTAKPGLNGLRVSETRAASNAETALYLVNSDDREGMVDAIARARAGNDIVLFSLHTHQNAEAVGDVPPDFIVSLAHDAVEAGADVVAMHGPHQLRGIEIHKGKPIFYSLGNFSIMLPGPELNPEPMVLPPGSIFTRRSFFESVVATLRFRAGQIDRVELFPIELRETDELNTHCLPRPVTGAKADAILDRLNVLSRPFGVEVRKQDGLGIIALGD